MITARKWHTCVDCGRNLASYHSLWRHKKTCQAKGIANIDNSDKGAYQTWNGDAERKRQAPPPLNNETIPREKRTIPSQQNDFEQKNNNPKIQALLDEILNDGIQR